MNSLAAGANLFSSPPPSPRINEVLRRKELPPPPLPRRPPLAKSPADSPALKAVHRRTKYHKPIPPAGGVLAADEHERKVLVGESGVSYLLPGAPFEFQFSYSEAPKAKPLAIREPAFLPFAPPSMPRPWTGRAPLKSKKEKDLKKQRRVRLLDSSDSSEQDDPAEGISQGRVLEMSQTVPGIVQFSSDKRSREEILGKPLSRSEIMALVKPLLSDNRQINLGRDGLTHNMLELIHTHWRRRKVCKVRCRGVPTVDMDNVCRHIEEKTGGKIIYRKGGIIYLFHGRNYDPQTRPRFPTMLWKPAAPVYPKLIQEIPDGLTRDEAVHFRKKGESLLPICKLAKNGIYITLVRNVREAFEGSPLVKIDCRGLHASDYKKIGAKLKELVPCVLLSFDDDQILMWRGKDWKSKYPKPLLLELNAKGVPSKKVEEGKIARLWRRAMESGLAMLLQERVCPDSLLHQVELFEASSQATGHSFPALISEVSDAEVEQDGDAVDGDSSDVDDDGLLDLPESSVPFGSLAVDSLAKHLYLD